MGTLSHWGKDPWKVGSGWPVWVRSLKSRGGEASCLRPPRVTIGTERRTKQEFRHLVRRDRVSVRRSAPSWEKAAVGAFLIGGKTETNTLKLPRTRVQAYRPHHRNIRARDGLDWHMMKARGVTGKRAGSDASLPPSLRCRPYEEMIGTRAGPPPQWGVVVRRLRSTMRCQQLETRRGGVGKGRVAGCSCCLGIGFQLSGAAMPQDGKGGFWLSSIPGSIDSKGRRPKMVCIATVRVWRFIKG